MTTFLKNCLRWLLALAALLALAPAQAQAPHGAAPATDLIVRTDNTVIKAKVTRVGPADIEYRRADNPDGPVYSVSRAEVATVVYANGTTEVFAARPAPVPTASPADGAPRRLPPLAGASSNPPAPAAPAAAPTTNRLPALTFADGYYAAYGETGAFGVAIGTIKRNGLPAEATFYYETAPSYNALGFTYVLTSALRSPQAFIPYYRAGLGGGWLWGGKADSRYTGSQAMLILGGGIAARAGSSLWRLGFDLQPVYTAVNYGYGSVGDGDNRYAIHLGYLF